jgi:hypothetical protein
MLTSRLAAKARASRPTRRDLSVYGTLSDGRRVPVTTGARFRAGAWPWPAARHLEPIHHDDTNANRIHGAADGSRDGIPGCNYWTSADVRHVAGQRRRQRAR